MTMEQFVLAEVQRRRASSNDLYVEFLRVPAMSVGVYELGVGAEDPQQPHTEDELYYVVSGKALLLVDTNDVAVEAGSLVYVPAHIVHRFHAITETLTVLVFFAPAEYTNRSSANTMSKP